MHLPCLGCRIISGSSSDWEGPMSPGGSVSPTFNLDEEINTTVDRTNISYLSANPA